MRDAIVALNAGSSSLKFSLFDPVDEPRSATALAHGGVDGIPAAPRLKVVDAAGVVQAERSIGPPGSRAPAEAALGAVLDWIEAAHVRVVAVGHRVVHGGERFVEPTLVDDAVIAQLRDLIPLAPLHEQHNLAGIEAYRRRHPGVPHVACFDTAFHHTQAAVVTRYALPRALSAQGIRRYGFHGLSYEYIASALPERLGRRADGRVIVAHLGSGASLCALLARRSVATTMGFTALDGLVMGTRCGALDPGVVLYLLERGMTAAELRDLLWERSGLLGVSEISADLRTLLDDDDVRAREAIESFVYRIVREIGSLAAALGGLDALVFTAGIGEHAAGIRQQVCAQLGWLGVQLDEPRNAAGESSIGVPAAACAVWVIPTDEEAVVARHVRDVLARTPGAS